MIWAIVAIAKAFGVWWVLALVLGLLLPKGLRRLVLYVWGGIALSALHVGGWLILFLILAVISIFSSSD